MSFALEVCRGTWLKTHCKSYYPPVAADDPVIVYRPQSKDIFPKDIASVWIADSPQTRQTVEVTVLSVNDRGIIAYGSPPQFIAFHRIKKSRNK